MLAMDLNEQCELGQQQLMRMEYLAAEATLAAAEAQAWANRDWDLLARLYMPLQEARRQIRIRCGEGVVALDMLALNADDQVSAQRMLEHYPHGQLLVGGWGTIEPAVQVRRLARERGLYVEALLGAVYPVGGRRAIVIVPTDEVTLPQPAERSIDELLRILPVGSIVLHEDEVARGVRKGSTETYAEVAALWEKLHAPFLASADNEADPVRRIEAYRRTIRVDYACELAHQKLSAVARELARAERS